MATTGVVTPLESDRPHSRAGARGAVYKPRSDGSIYLGYGTSTNPSAEGLALSAATVTLDPEKTRNFEVGTKWDVMGGRLSASAAVFRTEKTNARTPAINPGDPPTVLAGEQLVSGHRGRRLGTRHASVVGLQRLRVHGQHDRSVQHRRLSWTTRWR